MSPQECEAVGDVMRGMAGQMMNGGMMGGGWMWGGMLWFWLLALALIVAIGLAIVILVVRRSTGPAADDPREILRRRFARGELDTEAFVEAMKTLG